MKTDVIIISTEKNDLNLQLIHEFIATSYWGAGRTFDNTKKCINYSLNFGVYKNGQQIGYARVVTDYTLFAYLLDVFIMKSEQGKGYSKKLMNHIMTHPQLKDIQNWKLTTLDAHGLYEKYGFRILDNPRMIMERKLETTLN